MCVFGFCIYVLRQIIVIWLIQKLQLLWGVVVFASSHELEKVFRFSLPGIFRWPDKVKINKPWQTNARKKSSFAEVNIKCTF